MTDATEEMSVYVDTELLTRAKGALMLDQGREPTDEEVIGTALEALLDEHSDDSSPERAQMAYDGEFTTAPPIDIERDSPGLRTQFLDDDRAQLTGDPLPIVGLTLLFLVAVGLSMAVGWL